MAVLRHELIGTGPLGDTHRATVAGGFVPRRCAVKVLRREIAGDDVLLFRVGAAAQYAAELEGPGFATVHDFLVEGDRPLLVMDLVDGVDLHRLVDVVRARGEVLPPAAALAVLRDVAAALAAMHRRGDLVWQGVCQLGLWPQAIMIHADGRALLPAPGLLMSQLPRFWHKLEPERRWFVAPEVLAGGEVSPAADAFALGRLWSWLVGDATEELWPELQPLAQRLGRVEPSRRGDLERAADELAALHRHAGDGGRTALARYVSRYRARDTELYLPDPDDVAEVAAHIDEGPTQPFTRATPDELHTPPR